MTRTRKKSCKNTGQKSGAGTTCARSCRQEGTGPATLSAEDSHVRTSATPGAEPALAVNDPASGPNSLESFAYFDRGMSSWKTCQHSLFEGWDEFSETWPSSGMMRSGIAYRLPPLVPRICAGGCSLLPTPLSTDTKTVQQRTGRTPRERNSYQRDRGKKGKERLTLTGIVMAMYPTPRADSRDNCGGSNSRRIAKQRGTYIGRKLSPEFVEFMMGLPIGWTQIT